MKQTSVTSNLGISAQKPLSLSPSDRQLNEAGTLDLLSRA